MVGCWRDLARLRENILLAAQALGRCANNARVEHKTCLERIVKSFCIGQTWVHSTSDLAMSPKIVANGIANGTANASDYGDDMSLNSSV